MSELTAHGTLCDARNLTARKGWFGCRDDGGAYCVGLAIEDADGDFRSSLTAFCEHNGIGWVGDASPVAAVIRWNDAPGRTKEEVLAAFDRAISATAPAPADPLEGVEMAEVVA